MEKLITKSFKRLLEKGINRGFITYEELGKSLGKRNGTIENIEKAFIRAVHWGDPFKVFPFLKDYNFDFSLDPGLAKLIAIDAGQTVDYMLLKEGSTSQGFNIIDKCMNVLHKTIALTPEERELNKHLFLDQVFCKRKELSKAYHQDQLALYIQFEPQRLMDFLRATDEY